MTDDKLNDAGADGAAADADGQVPERPAVAAGEPDPTPLGEVARAGQAPLELIDVRAGMFGVHGSGDTSGFGGLVHTVLMPEASERPYGSYFDEVVDILAEVLAEAGVAYEDAIEKVVVFRGELTLFVVREHLPLVARSLRDDQDLRFELCLGVNGAHYPHDAGRELHCIYPLNSVTHNRTIRLEVVAPDSDPHIPSVVEIYPANDWHERETWDFFGVVFDGHPALTRIEMPDDWVGHPQRKDYPLGGIPVEYKGATVPSPDNRRKYS